MGGVDEEQRGELSSTAMIPLTENVAAAPGPDTRLRQGRLRLHRNARSRPRRGLRGTYHYVSRKYLQGYLSEFTFRL
jgi:hypothetical protein